MGSDDTTIKLSRKTKEGLDNLKEYKRETYDEVLEKALNILNTLKTSPQRSRAQLISIYRKKRSKSASQRGQRSPSGQHSKTESESNPS